MKESNFKHLKIGNDKNTKNENASLTLKQG